MYVCICMFGAKLHMLYELVDGYYETLAMNCYGC